MKKILFSFLSLAILVTSCDKKDKDPAPTATSVSPANNATGVSITPSLVITFNENIVAGTGIITVKDSATNTIREMINVATAVTISGNTATATGLILQHGTTYYVEVPNTAFKDAGGNAFAGISGSTTWKFKTLPAPPPVTPTMSNVAGSYRLDKLTMTQPGSSTEVDVTNQFLEPCERDDIFTFNSSGIYNYTDAGTICVPNGNDSGTWSLPSATTISLDGEVFTIRRFNGVNLDISITDPQFGTIIQYMVKQ